MAADQLRLLALSGHPIEAAGARYRMIQFIPGLQRLGFEVDHRPFFDSHEYRALYGGGSPAAKLRALVTGTVRRSAELMTARRYDVILVHIWIHPTTFPPFDAALRLLDVPLVYDFDDAYYSVGSASDRWRDRGWATRMMRVAHTVITGSEYLRDFIRPHNPRVEILPTAIDTDRFTPRDFAKQRNPRPVIGWVGSPPTTPYLETLYPVIQRLAKDHDFVFRVIGAGRQLPIDGVAVEYQPWTLAREVDNFRDLDIGLYPLQDSELSRGKHGFKLNQYRSVGVATVASAVGLNPEIVRHGENAFLAATPDQWYDALARLLDDEPLRRRVGLASRAQVDAEASLRVVTEQLAAILRRAAERKRS